MILGSGRSPGKGNGNPLQYSCLENPMNREARRATVHGVAKKSDMAEATQQEIHARNLLPGKILYFRHGYTRNVPSASFYKTFHLHKKISLISFQFEILVQQLSTTAKLSPYKTCNADYGHFYSYISQTEYDI